MDRVPRNTVGAARRSSRSGEARPGGSRPGANVIVGIGSSAGGLEACSELLRHLPPDTGMGVVCVQHLDPHHDNALPDLLAKSTPLPVLEARSGLRVRANHIYVIPPNAELRIARGILRLRRRQSTQSGHRAIDLFFEALAEDQQERAIGVVLSGTATDGTRGLEAIKAAGGVTFAQDESARYDSMPRSAVLTGCVDHVLPPQRIATELGRMASHPALAAPSRVGAPSARDGSVIAVPGRDADRSDAGFQNVLLQLRRATGVDFSLYKRSTIERRIARRMVLSRQTTLHDYVRLLKGNAKELVALYADALIGVTSFFRDPDNFSVLQHKVLTKLLAKGGDDPLRVWVVGCATGEEVYSIAMGLVEAADRAARGRSIHVFGTDLNTALLNRARAGLYTRTAVQDVSAERLRRFFVEEAGGYRVSKAIREMVVLARQDLTSDPPFSRLDLISCRNLLIYLDAGTQSRLFPLFHYALKPGGFLYLGASESIGEFSALFDVVDKPAKIYARKGFAASLPRLPAIPALGKMTSVGSLPAPLQAQVGDAVVAGALGTPSAQYEAECLLVHRFAPPGVLINADLQVLHFRGSTRAYLEPPTGRATLNILKMVRAGLMQPLRAAIAQARREGVPVRTRELHANHGGRSWPVTVEVIPLRQSQEPYFLIVFDEAGRTARREPELEARHAPAKRRSPRGAAARRIHELETELTETREHLRTVQEQHEAAIEQLQASNEEMQSSNEELQSLNEEVQTSKEELESANEELATVNDELSSRNTELNRLNSDLFNFQSSAHIAMVQVGRDLTIHRVTAEAERLLNIGSADLGRSIVTFRHVVKAIDLVDVIARVVERVIPEEHELQHSGGGWLSVRIQPYLTLGDNAVDGAVLAFVDIDALKRSELVIAAARDFAETIVDTVREPLVVLDDHLRVASANRAFYRTFRSERARAEGRLIYELADHAWDIPRLRKLLEQMLLQNTTVEDFLVEQEIAHLGRRTMLLNARRLNDLTSASGRILLAIEDVTERQREMAAQQHFRALFEGAPGCYLVLAPDDYEIVAVSDAYLQATMTERDAITGQRLFEVFPDDPGYPGADGVKNLAASLDRVRTTLRSDVMAAQFYPIRRPVADGGKFEGRWWSPVNSPVLGPDGRLTFIIHRVEDVTPYVQAQQAEGRLADGLHVLETRAQQMEADIVLRAQELQLANARLRESEQRFRLLFEHSPLPKWLVDRSTLRFIEVNTAAVEHYGYSREEFAAMLVSDLDISGAAEAFGAALADASADTAQGQIHRHRRKSGDVIDVETWISDFALTGKRVALVSLNDVTERRRAETALRAADQRKDEFLAMLSHELRGPLAPIRNAVELVRHGRRAESSIAIESRRRGNAVLDTAVAVLSRQVDHLVRLVDDLLDVNRLSRGKMSLRRQQVELRAIVDQAVEAIQSLVDERDLRLQVTMATDLPDLSADGARLVQVLSNLLHNATKFTPRGGRISLIAERDAAHPKAEIVIRILDTGRGMAPQELERVFELFAQTDTSVDRTGSGLGIGLSLARQLVEMHGGTVQAQSAGEGQGSEFVVRLPITSGEPIAHPAGQESDRDSVTTARRILVVDDNQDSADSLAFLLEQDGHETHAVYDGTAAVTAAETLQPDVILLDLGLPGLSGYEVAERIRRAESPVRPWLIALTGWGQEADRRRSKNAGFDTHLVKPVDYTALKHLLGRSDVADM